MEREEEQGRTRAFGLLDFADRRFDRIVRAHGVDWEVEGEGGVARIGVKGCESASSLQCRCPEVSSGESSLSRTVLKAFSERPEILQVRYSR